MKDDFKRALLHSGYCNCCDLPGDKCKKDSAKPAARARLRREVPALQAEAEDELQDDEELA